MENKEVIAPAGTLLLVNSGVIHDVDVKKGLEGIVLLIDRNLITLSDTIITPLELLVKKFLLTFRYILSMICL